MVRCFIGWNQESDPSYDGLMLILNINVRVDAVSRNVGHYRSVVSTRRSGAAVFPYPDDYPPLNWYEKTLQRSEIHLARLKEIRDQH